MNRAIKIAKGLAALGILVTLVAGIPWALWHYVGWPLPHGLPSWSRFTTALDQQGIPDQVLLKALACVVWISWAILATSVLVEVPAALRGRAARRLAAIGPLQPLVGHLVAAILVATLAVLPRPVGNSPSRLAAKLPSGPPRQPVVALALVSEVTTAPAPPATNADAPAAATPAPLTYVVQRGDTLWGIAQRQLGDPLRWREIFALNDGRPQPTGQVLTDPNWIYPGWILELPAPSAALGTQPRPRAAPLTPSPLTATEPPPPTQPAGQPPAANSPTTATPPSTSTPSSTRPPVPAPTAGSAHGRSIVERTPPSVALPSGSVVAGSFAAGVLATVAIGWLRRRHGYRPSAPEPGRSSGAPPLGSTLRHLSNELVDADPDGHDSTTDDPTVVTDDDERRKQPDLVDVGERDGQTIGLRLSDIAGVAVVGPGADDVVRAWVAALLTRAGPLAAEMVTTTSVIERLCPGIGEIPGIRVTGSSEQVLRIVEAQSLSRTRQLRDAEVEDVVSYRRANPWEPMPTIMVVLDQVAPGSWPRWQAALTAAPLLGIGVAFLDDLDDSPLRIELVDNRLVAALTPESHLGRLHGARLFGMTSTETADVLTAIADSEFRPSGEENPEWSEVIERMERPAPPTEPWPDPPVSPRRSDAAISIRALGPLKITARGETVSTGLRSVAKELLAWYVMRPEGATVEAAVEALWPDTDPRQVHRQFWTATSSIRSRLRENTNPDLRVLDQVGDVYRLDPDDVTCDVWDFQQALGVAAKANDDRTACDALQRAVEVYGGNFVQGSHWIWVEPAREDLHRRALDAHLRLAELHERLGDLEPAQATLERVVDLDRYAEEPYRRLMMLQSRQGRDDAVRTTWRLLQRRLLDLDLDPDPSSLRLYRSLTESHGSADRDTPRRSARQ